MRLQKMELESRYEKLEYQLEYEIMSVQELETKISIQHSIKGLYPLRILGNAKGVHSSLVFHKEQVKKYKLLMKRLVFEGY